MGKTFLILNFISCSADCTIEDGYGCDTSEPSVCYELCGDGYNYGNFDCDDGNTDDNDG